MISKNASAPNLHSAQRKMAKKENAKLYAPRPKPAAPVQRVDPRVRKLVVRTLEDLKRPDAVPSQVLHKAFDDLIKGKDQ